MSLHWKYSSVTTIALTRSWSALSGTPGWSLVSGCEQWWWLPGEYVLCAYVCVYVCMYVCMYICVCVCVCVYVSGYACLLNTLPFLSCQITGSHDFSLRLWERTREPLILSEQREIVSSLLITCGSFYWGPCPPQIGKRGPVWSGSCWGRWTGGELRLLSNNILEAMSLMRGEKLFPLQIPGESTSQEVQMAGKKTMETMKAVSILC